MRKRLLTLALAVLAMLQTAWAYDFSATSPSGHTLYYEIISGTTNVGVVRPGTGSTYDNYVTGNVVIPATVTYGGTTYNVTELRSVSNYGAFSYCSGLTSVTIPNSVTSIGSSAFRHCFGLTSVTIGNSVTSIGGYAFYNCRGLTSVTIPNSVTSIGSYAFWDCSRLTSVTIPNSVTSIGNYAFYLVKNIIYNGTATGSPWGALSVNGYIEGDFVYANNTKTSLLAYIGTSTSVTIPNSVTSIESYAFYDCSGLTSVTIPNSVTSIGEGAFYYCSGLTSVTIPNSVTSIGEYAFYNCSGLTSVTIPNSVTSIGQDAFYMVRNIIYSGTATGSPWGALSVNGYIEGDFVYANNTKTSLLAYIGTSTSVTIPNSVTSIGEWAFYNCSGLTSVTIPNSVDTIHNGTFYNCTSLTSITIPNSVTDIVQEAFSGCSSLTSVTIGNSVRLILYEAFAGCNNLYEVISLSVNPPLLFNGFSGTVAIPILKVPCGSADAYSSSRWSQYFVDIEEICDNVTITVTSANESMGTVLGSGEYEFGTEVTITAIPNEGYRFVSWNDGNTDNPRTITVTEDATYIAIFEEGEEVIRYTITVLSANGSMGTVSGGGEYEVGTEITITAIPNEGYHFVTWNDGNTDNPRTITVTEDATYIASFEEGVGIESRDMLSELTFYPNPTSGIITFNRSDIMKVEVLDAMGRTVEVYENAYTIDISKLAKGYYAMRITTAEGVAVRKVIRK